MSNRSGFINKMKVGVKLKSGAKRIAGVDLTDLELEVDPSIVGQLNEQVGAIYHGVRNDNIRDKIDATKIRQESKSITIGTDETKIPHSLGVKPSEYCVMPKESGIWYQSKDPDSSYVYLVATAAMSVNIVIKG